MFYCIFFDIGNFQMFIFCIMQFVGYSIGEVFKGKLWEEVNYGQEILKFYEVVVVWGFGVEVVKVVGERGFQKLEWCEKMF